MEKEMYRANLERLLERFGKDAVTISLNEAAKYVGCDYRTLKDNKDFHVIKFKSRSRVTLTELARWLS